jgi:threonine aldolase
VSLDFASDNWSAATPAVQEAIAAASAGSAPAYGDDDLTARVKRRFCEVFEREVAVHFVLTGTAANLLCLQAASRPSGFVLCSDEAHLLADEYNGPEFFTGMKLVPVPSTAARMSAETLDTTLASMLPPDQRGPLAVLSLTNATEYGTAYAAAEVAELAGIGRAHGMAVHVDGARFANAVAATGDSPADLTWRAGVDLMSFGGTKNGCWAAEAVVVFDPAAYPDLHLLRQRSGHGLSKQRFVAAQYDGYLADDAWLSTAAHANAMAARLAAGIERAGTARLGWPPATNELFPVMAKETAARLREGGARFHTWQDLGEEEMVRLVTSFATTEAEVDGLLALLGEAGRP